MVDGRATGGALSRPGFGAVVRDQIEPGIRLPADLLNGRESAG